MQPEFENLFFGLRPFTLRESILDGCRVRIAELRNQTEYAESGIPKLILFSVSVILEGSSSESQWNLPLGIAATQTCIYPCTHGLTFSDVPHPTPSQEAPSEIAQKKRRK